MSADRLVYIGTYTYPGRSEGICVYRLDGATGRLEPTGQVAAVPSPVCMLFAGGA